jgi:hypothetical protein
VGGPLGKDDPSFQQRLDELAAQYLTALVDLYDQCKCEYFDGHQSWAARPLVLL